MPHHVIPHLIVGGNAEQTNKFDVSLIEAANIGRLERYGPGEPGAEGSVKQAEFTPVGRRHLCIDRPAKHDFTFTPSISLFVACKSAGEFERLHEQLASGGKTLMPPVDYGFSTRFAWLNDRFDVSW